MNTQKLFETIERLTGHQCLESEMFEIVDAVNEAQQKPKCECKYEHYTNEYNETVAVCPKCMDAYF